MTLPTPTRGLAWAYTGAIIGGAVSVAANVAHSYVPPADAPADWTPQIGAVVGAVFWPVSLFVAIEILARIDWPAGKRWIAVRYLGLLPVALVAAVVSYRHLSGLLVFYGEDPLTATIGPLAVDGLMVMATGALLAARRPTPTAEPDTTPVEPDTTHLDATSTPVEPDTTHLDTGSPPRTPEATIDALDQLAVPMQAGEPTCRTSLLAADIHVPVRTLRIAVKNRRARDERVRGRV